MLPFSTRLAGRAISRSSGAHEGWGRFVICFGHCDIAHFGLVFGLGRAWTRSSSRKQRGRGQDDQFAHGTPLLITLHTRSASASTVRRRASRVQRDSESAPSAAPELPARRILSVRVKG